MPLSNRKRLLLRLAIVTIPFDFICVLDRADKFDALQMKPIAAARTLKHFFALFVLFLAVAKFLIQIFILEKNFLVFLPRNVDYLGYNGFFLGFFLGERLFFRLFFLRVQFLFQLAFDFLAAQLFLLPFLWNKSVQEIPAVQP